MQWKECCYVRHGGGSGMLWAYFSSKDQKNPVRMAVIMKYQDISEKNKQDWQKTEEV